MDESYRLPTIPGMTSLQVAMLPQEELAELLEIEPPKPWEQQPSESSRAHAAFLIYRDQGPKRTLAETMRRWYVGDKPKTSKRVVSPGLNGEPGVWTSRISQWSRDHNWRARAQMWDQENQRLEHEAHIEAFREVKKREAEIVMLGYEKLSKALEEMQSSKIGPKEFPTITLAMARLARLAYDQPTETVGYRNEDFGVLAQLSEEELDDRLLKILQRAGTAGVDKTHAVAAEWTDRSGAGRNHADHGVEGTTPPRLPDGDRAARGANQVHHP
jgi:hypothetical protein